jgi:hypothetical protein
LTRIGNPACIQRLALLVVLVLVKGCADSTRGADKELAVTITSIVEKLVQDNATVESLAHALGRITEKERRRYRLAPADERFREARIGFESGGGGEKPRYIDLLLHSNAVLRVADLAAAFGTAEEAIPSPEGNPHGVRFRFDKPHFPFLAVIDASLTGLPDDPATKIESLTIRREERI